MIFKHQPRLGRHVKTSYSKSHYYKSQNASMSVAGNWRLIASFNSNSRSAYKCAPLWSYHRALRPESR